MKNWKEKGESRDIEIKKRRESVRGMMQKDGTCKDRNQEKIYQKAEGEALEEELRSKFPNSDRINHNFESSNSSLNNVFAGLILESALRPLTITNLNKHWINVNWKENQKRQIRRVRKVPICMYVKRKEENERACGQWPEGIRSVLVTFAWTFTTGARVINRWASLSISHHDSYSLYITHVQRNTWMIPRNHWYLNFKSISLTAST